MAKKKSKKKETSKHTAKHTSRHASAHKHATTHKRATAHTSHKKHTQRRSHSPRKHRASGKRISKKDIIKVMNSTGASYSEAKQAAKSYRATKHWAKKEKASRRKENKIWSKNVRSVHKAGNEAYTRALKNGMSKSEAQGYAHDVAYDKAAKMGHKRYGFSLRAGDFARTANRMTFSKVHHKKVTGHKHGKVRTAGKEHLAKSVITKATNSKVHKTNVHNVTHPSKKTQKKVNLNKSRQHAVNKALRDNSKLTALKRQIKNAQSIKRAAEKKYNYLNYKYYPNSNHSVITDSLNASTSKEQDKYYAVSSKAIKRIKRLKKQYSKEKKRTKKRAINKFNKKHHIGKYKKHPIHKTNRGPKKGIKTVTKKGPKHTTLNVAGYKGGKKNTHKTKGRNRSHRGGHRKSAVAAVSGAVAGASVASHAGIAKAASHGKHHGKHVSSHVRRTKGHTGKASAGANYRGGSSRSSVKSTRGKSRRKSTAKSASLSVGSTGASGTSNGRVDQSPGFASTPVDPGLMNNGFSQGTINSIERATGTGIYAPSDTGTVSTGRTNSHLSNGYTGVSNKRAVLGQGSYATGYPTMSTGTMSQYPATSGVMNGTISLEMLQQEIQIVQKEISQIVQVLQTRQVSYTPTPQYNSTPSYGIPIGQQNQNIIHDITEGLNTNSHGISKDKEAVQDKPKNQVTMDDALVASNKGDNSLQQMANNGKSGLLTNAPQSQSSTQIQLGQ